jgi:hypothetical protein
MPKILCAALLLALSAGTSAEETTQVIVGGPAPLVGGIESRPLGSLDPCENVAFAERSKCLQQVADGPGTQIRAAPTVPLTTPPQPDPAAQRALERCDTLRGEEKERCAKDAKAAAAAEEKLRGPESVGAGATAAPAAR